MTSTQIVVPPGEQTITMTRTFDAPADLVFRAYTEPELVRRWLGPRRLKMTIEQWDVADGGRYRYVHAEPDGSAEYGFHGVFHGVPSVEHGITQTFEFEGMPGHVSLEHASFSESVVDGVVRTTVHGHVVFQSVADRDGMAESGMETGVNEGHEQLDELLAELSSRV